jgi:hypothetical protein
MKILKTIPLTGKPKNLGRVYNLGRNYGGSDGGSSGFLGSSNDGRGRDWRFVYLLGSLCLVLLLVVFIMAYKRRNRYA